MIKKLLILSISLFVVGITPSIAQEEAKPTIEKEMSSITISVQGSTIYIKNADQMSLDIYDIRGIKVKSLRIDSPETSIELSNLPKGCYIVKIGKYVRKVYIK